MCDGATAQTREALDRRYADTIHPLLVRSVVEGGCADCHAPTTSYRLIVWPEDPQRTFEAMWSAGLLDPAAPPRSLLAVLAEDAVLRMPLGRDPWPEEERAQMTAFICDLEASEAEPPPLCDGPPDPGHVPLRRLSNAQYGRSVEAALGYQGPLELAADEVAFGFDAVAEGQRLSTAHFERYAETAERVAEDTLFVSEPLDLHFEAEALEAWLYNGNRPGNGHGWPRDTDGDGAADVYHFQRIVSYVTPGLIEVEHPGTYTVTVRARGYNADQRVLRDGELVTTESDVPPELRVDFGSAHNATVAVEGLYLDWGPWMQLSLTFQNVPAGPHELRVGLTNMGYGPNRQRDVRLRVDHFQVSGPARKELPPVDEARVERYLICEDGGDSACNQRAVEKVLSTLWRRPATAEEVARYRTALLENVLGEGGSFRDGLTLVLEAALLSPHFLYRVELSAPQLSGFELAQRLSYLLWSAPPDETLLARAQDGTLETEAGLLAEVDRMFEDPRASALVEDFGAQWLGLDKLEELMLSPDVYPELDPELRDALATELRLLFSLVVNEDRDLRELLDSDVTFVNDRLAAHYGLPLPGSGPDFVPVNVGEAPRGGLLESGGVHAITSHPDRTSPTLRGRWLLENLLCQPPADPPADADTNIDKPDLEGLTLRERLALHSTDPACASCHAMMDPLGLSMEHFDALGRWRQTDDFGDPVDPSGVMPDGTTVSDHRDVLAWLASRPAFERCVTSKMAVYALGRSPRSLDACALDEVRQRWSSSDRSMRGLIKALVQSPLFRQRRPEAPGEYDHLTGGP